MTERQMKDRWKTDRQTDRQAGKQTDRQTDRQAGLQTDRQTDRQTQADRQLEVLTGSNVTTERGEDGQGETDTFNKYIFVAHLVLA